MNRFACLLAAVLVLAPALLRAADPEKASEDQRAESVKQANRFSNLGHLAFQAGDYPQAIELTQKAYALQLQLYPKDEFPQGHRHLATSLSNLGTYHAARGDFTKAEAFHLAALEMCKQLYPKDQYPKGHEQLAQTMNNLGGLYQDLGLYARAEPLYRAAYRIRQHLFLTDEFKKGHPDLAQSLNSLGVLFLAQEDYGRAEPILRAAVLMYQNLYPKEKFPHGHPQLAVSLNNLATALRGEGEIGMAEPVLRQSVAMLQEVYPKDKFPNGHPTLAGALHNLATLEGLRGQYDQAEQLYLEVLQTNRALYPSEKFPAGHPQLAAALSNLAIVRARQGKYPEAERLFDEALEMRQRLYPREKYPDGHPLIAQALRERGTFFVWAREYEKAEAPLQDALRMVQKLYPKESYPQGHPSVAAYLSDLAALFKARGDLARAADLYRDAIRGQQAHFRQIAEVVSETQALNFAAWQQSDLHSLLETTRDLPTAERVYPFVWEAKGALSKIQLRRHLDLVAANDETTRETARRLQETRQRLARLLLTPARDGSEQLKAVRKLAQEKEELERTLYNSLRISGGPTAQTTPEQLRDRLPPGAVFVDLLRYGVVRAAGKEEKGPARVWRYVAFVIQPGQEVARVELGDAEPIEKAWREWRAALVQGAPDREAAATVVRLVWQPTEAKFGAKATTVWIAPDADLNGVPWGALPGTEANSVLLERFAIGAVPHGDFLLRGLQAEPLKDVRKGVLLALGGVEYDGGPEVARRQGDDFDRREAAIGDKAPRWKSLPATDRERQQLAALAEKLLDSQPLDRTGAAASAAQLLTDLPRVRYAHLATHGFFAGKQFRSAFQVNETPFGPESALRTKIGWRNPLVLSGLVLAGANQPDAPDRGILTAEAVVGLPLDRLDLAVLSACETGLGDVAGGEGVFGLQRAFHIAGARNVVASLWKVDDDATAALMALFYRNLWVENQPPLEALRQAQLHLFRHPEQVDGLAKARGVDFTEKELPKVEAAPTVKEARAHASRWAGFVLSGDGR